MNNQEESLKAVYIFARNISLFSHYVRIQFTKNSCISKAAALTYTSLLAFVPFLSLSFSIMSSFVALKDVQHKILTYIFKHLMMDPSHIFIENINNFINNTQHVDLLGITVLIFSMILVFNTIEKTFNIIWGIKTGRSVIQRFLSFWTLITFGPILVALGINVLSTFALGFSDFTCTLNGFFLKTFVFIAPIISLTLIFTFLYMIVPNHRVPLIHALIGAFIAALFIEICRHLFIAYISYIPSYRFVYKTLATLPIFIVWMYIFWAVALLGAQITASLPNWGNILSLDSFLLTSTQTFFLNGIRILEIINHSNHKGIGFPEIIKNLKIGEKKLEELLALLQEARLIEQSQAGLFFLMDDPSKITLFKVYNGLKLGVQNIPQVDCKRIWKSHWDKIVINKISDVDTSTQVILNCSLDDIFNPPSPSVPSKRNS